MRVISGSARRIQLEAPSEGTRPTTDRLKETLFNIINPYLLDASVLDLFAGSGALGIESLSRGGAQATFVDIGNEAIQCLQNNLNRTKLIEKAKILKYDYEKACDVLGKEKAKFDIIFLDPPYNKGFELEALKRIDEFELLADDGIIILETESTLPIDLGDLSFEITRQKNFKKTNFTFIGKEGGKS